ncbi:Aste57867_19488 [Aphanomyces stellatus]|uniref:Aste57867_19488 protein n=1 Tax=Aphanomyces stellatus TaxID=120398 RepID=A0A485LHD4_9STRA|nr:hypothetical protein As57867_019424 [Aphanomyces stellatus]VFT96199.1 Aste57867_19488 [Aphanomyces stellatus]
MEGTAIDNGVTTAGMDPASVKAMNRRLKKNTYQRQKQATYRKLDKMEMAFQRERVVVLEEMLEQARQKMRGRVSAARCSSVSTVLSWQDIALALQESEGGMVTQNDRLKKQVQRARTLADELKLWVFNRIPSYPATSMWKNVGLMTSLESRQVGMDWITKQLFFNMDVMFQKYEFPPPESAEAIDDYLYYYDGDGLVAVQRNQYIVKTPLETFHARITDDKFMGDENLNAHRPLNPEILHRVYDDARGLRKNFVSRVHVQPHQIAFVGQNINDDELFPTDKMQQHRVIMSCYERVGPHQTKIRSMQIMSSLFDKSGTYISVDQEAAVWGYDLGDCPDHLKQERYLQCAKQAIANQVLRRQLIKKSS